jgi:chromosome segregation ATPase
MRALMSKLASRAGLVPRAKADHLAEVVERGQGKIAELKKAIEDARSETKIWKTKCEETTKKVSETATEDSAKWAKRFEKVQEDLERVREREERHRARIAELHEKAQASERALRIAREQLMAVEVKLDIVEGALTVLDSRTRAALSAADRVSAAASAAQVAKR